jgi:tetratricopeptide (TPR) repeat protein
MNQDRLEELDARLRRMRLADRDADLTDILTDELRNSKNDEEKLYVYSLLISELQNHGRVEEAEATIRARIEIRPNKPDSWITLALHYFYYANQPAEALSAINTAIDKARLDGNFVRQSHIERIRIALDLRRYPVVEESLTELLEYEPERESLDVQLESDFLSRIPSGVVNAAVIERYKTKLSTKS